MKSYGALLSFVIVDVAWHIDIGRILDDTKSENGILNLTRTFDSSLLSEIFQGTTGKNPRSSNIWLQHSSQFDLRTKYGIFLLPLNIPQVSSIQRCIVSQHHACCLRKDFFEFFFHRNSSHNRESPFSSYKQEELTKS